MKQQKDYTINSTKPMKIHSQNEEEMPQKDYLYKFQTGISTIEIHSKFFYIIHEIEMLFLVIISGLSFFTISKVKNPIIIKFNSILTLLYISPSIFNDQIYATYTVIGVIIFLTFLMALFTFLIGRRVSKNLTINQLTIKIWIMLTHLFLPIPGHIIGYYYGYHLCELTHSIHFNQLAFITFAGIFWCWTIITCNIIYNSYPFKRNNDICQIKHDYSKFQNIILILPMLQGMGPSFATVFFPMIDFYVYSILSFFKSLFILIFITIKKPYHENSMNNYSEFLFIVQMQLSLILLIEKHFAGYFEYYCIFIAAFIILSPVIIFKFSSKSPNENLSNNNQKTKKNTNIFDPTINFPFPFNRVSLTKTDIFLWIYVFSCVIFMEILNAIAAQRLPSIGPLPDFIHNRFIISKCIRSNFTNTYSQISNDFILFQIALLFFILFVFPEHFDFRRAVLIYGVICIIRSISFILTSLPVPCAGDPNCPCADRQILIALKKGNPVSIAMSWLFGLGMFLSYPECGDLIISGHTVCIWLFTRTCSAALASAIKRPFNWLVSGFLYTFSIFSMGYIIMSKNHYSIDVWFGLVLTEMMWNIYNATLKSALKEPQKSDTLGIRLVRWIEDRPPGREIVVYNSLKENVNKNSSD